MNASKLVNLLLVLSSGIVYLRDGEDVPEFLFQVEWGFVYHLFKDPVEYFGKGKVPFEFALLLILPFYIPTILGQILLIISLFQKRPGRRITFLGLIGSGMLVLWFFFMGISGRHFLMAVSTLPFILLAIYRIMNRKSIEVESRNAQSLSE